MSTIKRKRDSLGKFTSSKDDEEGKLNKINISSIWNRVKVVMVLLIFVVLSLPWTILIYEPTKNFGSNIGDMLTNYTTEIKDSYCHCSRSSLNSQAL
jgi:hypothetical protein